VRIVKWALLVLVILAVLAGGAAAGYFYVLHPKSRAAVEMKAPATPEAIERGRYLAMHVTGCIACHSETDFAAPGDPLIAGREGSGKEWPEIPEFPGRLRAPNITSDKETGLGNWTDGEIVRAMREGVSRDGRPLFPMMPYGTFATHLSDEDALAIVAYLRTLPPIAKKVDPVEVGFPVSMFVRTAPKPVERPLAKAPDPSDTLARGRWLLQAMSCADCHTPSEKGEPLPGKQYAGGASFPLPAGTVYASNITSDKATGIGAYSDEDLLRVLSEGIGKAGQPLYLMPWPFYKGLTDADKKALIAALREIPPVSNVVPASTIKR
jgi:mono/diheme cytochrome c family protein